MRKLEVSTIQSYKNVNKRIVMIFVIKQLVKYIEVIYLLNFVLTVGCYLHV